MAFAAIPAVLAVAGAGVSAYGAIQGAQAQSSALNYQAQVAKNNQVIAEQSREYALEAGQAQAHTTALKGRAIGGKIKAMQAASGVDVNTGSPVDVQESQREQSQLDVETVLNNAQLSAYGYRVKGDNYASEATLKEKAADDAETAGYVKAAGGLLSSAGSLGFKWQGTTPETPSPFTGREPDNI